MTILFFRAPIVLFLALSARGVYGGIENCDPCLGCGELLENNMMPGPGQPGSMMNCGGLFEDMGGAEGLETGNMECDVLPPIFCANGCCTESPEDCQQVFMPIIQCLADNTDTCSQCEPPVLSITETPSCADATGRFCEFLDCCEACKTQTEAGITCISAAFGSMMECEVPCANPSTSGAFTARAAHVSVFVIAIAYVALA